MNSKKLGMFASAALTVLATQAAAGEKTNAKAAASKDAMVCANTCGSVSGSGCGGKVLVKGTFKDEAACTKASGKWMPKAEHEKLAAAAKGAPAAAPHAHDHK